MERRIALKNLIRITNRNVGFTPCTPSDFNALSMMIKCKTKDTISLSSIKRLWGYVNYESFPSPTTLNILARFNGYRNWEEYLIDHVSGEEGDISEFFSNYLVDSASLSVGDEITVAWGEDKWCRLEYQQDLRFKVVSSHNIKLRSGDTFGLHTLCVGLPFYAFDIRRGDEEIAGYIGAKEAGITSIQICDPRVNVPR